MRLTASRQKEARSPNCICRGLSAAVGRPKLAAGVAPVPKILFGSWKFDRLSVLNASAITSNPARSVKLKPAAQSQVERSVIESAPRVAPHACRPVVEVRVEVAVVARLDVERQRARHK